MDDLILIPLGIAVALKMIPPGVLAECRDQAQTVMSQGKPESRAAVAVIITIWLLLAALAVIVVAQALQI